MANNIIIGGRSGGKMKAMFDEAIRGRIQELGEENERLKTGIAALRAENERLAKSLKEYKEAEESVSDAYLRIRALVKSYNTKPGGSDRFEVTEQAIKDLQNENERLRAACIKKNYAIEQTLGRALGYVEPDGTVNVCEHTAETLAMGAARELSVRERQAEILAGEGWSNGKTVDPFKSERLSNALSQARAEIAKEEKPEPERDSTLSQAHVVSYGKEPEVKP